MPYCNGADGVRLYYEDFGDGPSLVFTCGGLSTHKQWDGQVGALSQHFRTVTYDWRGTGESDKPRSGYTAGTAAADLCALIENLKVGPAVLVGCGIGTHVTLLAGLARPDLVRGMVIASGAPWFSGEKDGLIGGLSKEYIDFVAGRAQLPDDNGDHWHFHKLPDLHTLITFFQEFAYWPKPVLNSYVASMVNLDHRGRLNDVAWPTLILHGRHDKKQRYEGAQYLSTHIVGSKLVTFENSAHMGQVEEPDKFNRAITDFMLSL